MIRFRIAFILILFFLVTDSNPKVSVIKIVINNKNKLYHKKLGLIKDERLRKYLINFSKHFREKIFKNIPLELNDFYKYTHTLNNDTAVLKYSSNNRQYLLTIERHCIDILKENSYKKRLVKAFAEEPAYSLESDKFGNKIYGIGVTGLIYSNSYTGSSVYKKIIFTKNSNKTLVAERFFSDLMYPNIGNRYTKAYLTKDFKYTILTMENSDASGHYCAIFVFKFNKLMARIIIPY